MITMITLLGEADRVAAELRGAMKGLGTNEAKMVTLSRVITSYTYIGLL